MDDNDGFRALIRNWVDKEPELALLGEAGEGPTAIRLIGELAPDIVIMDVILPGINGIEVTRQLTALYPTVKVVALSMHAEDRFVASMRTAGASGYVLKDQVFEELRPAIHSVMSGQHYFPG